MNSEDVAEADSASNRYIVIPPRSSQQIAWNPFDAEDLPVPDCAYLGGVFVAMEHATTIRGLIFYITSNLESLPTYGDDVVVVHISDEWCRIPRYCFKVRAIFKTYGTRLPMHWGAILHPTPYDLASLAQDVRTAWRRLPSLLSAARSYTRELRHGKRPLWNVYTIPLGYFRQTDLTYIDIASREFDAYFAGSFTNSGTSSRTLNRLTPKFLSRMQLFDRLRSLAKRHPELAISTTTTASFLGTTDDEVARYSKTMMQTKICLVPRGTSLETYRFFEGLRSGCVIICERLPRRWFYDRSPALRVKTWAELDSLIPALVADASRLRCLSKASLSWWSEQCSERAVGKYIAERIRQPACTESP